MTSEVSRFEGALRRAGSCYITRMLSRFVASTGSPRSPVVEDPTTIEDVRCVVRLRGGRELVVATEIGGGVRVLGDRGRLAKRALAQLSFHDVVSGHVLELDTDELHVFDLHTLEMLPDAPGVNDALYLYGAMRGPYPAKLDTPVASVDGQLTVTRADLLDGLIDGVAKAFRYAPEPYGSRCVYAVLPGERADVIDTGRGIVLALPLAPGWLLDCPVPNDLIVAQMLYDVLSALRTELPSGLDASLPVPDRASYERTLVAAGWRIEGDEAVRAKGRGILGSLLRGDERKKLPRQGTLEELVAEATAVLSRMPDVPTAEARALRRRFAHATARALPSVSPPIRAVGVSPSPAAPPVATARVAARLRVAADRSEWMKDFVDAHRSPSRPAPRLSTPARAVAPAAQPTWMDDFVVSEGDVADPVETPPSNPPDWSKDFD
jgi:hypothetical protein